MDHSSAVEEAWIVEPMGGGVGPVFTEKEAQMLDDGWDDLMSAFGDDGFYR